MSSSREYVTACIDDYVVYYWCGHGNDRRLVMAEPVIFKLGDTEDESFSRAYEQAKQTLIAVNQTQADRLRVDRVEEDR